MGRELTYLQIVNKTNLTITTDVSQVENSDWPSVNRPDLNFKNIVMEPESSIKKCEEINAAAVEYGFRMHLLLSNGDEISFLVDPVQLIDKRNGFYELEGKDKDKYSVTLSYLEDNTYSFVVFPFTLHDWMRGLPDNVSMFNFSIPGTHQSCAINDYWGYAKCQEWWLKEQLQHGVRYFDVRGEAKASGYYIKIVHGRADQPYTFESVLKDVVQFLKENPSEAVFLQLSQESSSWDDMDYAKLVDHHLEDSRFKRYIHLDQNMMRMEDVRGKIVLVNRFINKNDKYGINVKDWPYNSLGSRDNGSVQYNIQDVCELSPNPSKEYTRDEKMHYVNQFFGGYAYRFGNLNLCFCSGYNKALVTPEQVASGPNGVNERTSRQHLQSRRGWNGVILFDFIDSYHSITVPYIIKNNFPYIGEAEYNG